MPAKNTLTQSPVQQAMRESEAHVADALKGTRKRRDWGYVRLDTINGVDTPFQAETLTLEQRVRLFFAADYERLRGDYRRKCLRDNIKLPGSLEEDVATFKEKATVKTGKNELGVEMAAVWMPWLTAPGGDPTHEPDY